MLLNLDKCNLLDYLLHVPRRQLMFPGLPFSLPEPTVPALILVEYAVLLKLG